MVFIPPQVWAFISTPLAVADQVPSPYRVLCNFPPGAYVSFHPWSQHIVLPDRSAAVAMPAVAGEEKAKAITELVTSDVNVFAIMSASSP
jgi:hypothetical protein